MRRLSRVLLYLLCITSHSYFTNLMNRALIFRIKLYVMTYGENLIFYTHYSTWRLEFKKGLSSLISIYEFLTLGK